MDLSEQDGGDILTLRQVRTVHTCNDYTRPEATAVQAEELRILENTVETVVVIETGAESCDSNPDDPELKEVLKSLRTEPEVEPIQEPPRSVESRLLESPRTHPRPCDRCGRCRCKKCVAGATAPLPSCLLCSQRCLCSPEATVDYLSCACCLKALLYHCGSDEEDGSADAPFSCHRQHRCKRWSTAAATTVILPCLLCYGPLRGCLALCQLCHRRANRPGCQCKKVKT